MARKSSWNPLSFVPFQVTVISSAVYIALFAVLLWVHTTVPSAPSDPTPVKGINLTEAWLDLDFISNGYHPIDSRRNGVVKEFLLKRVETILKGNGAGYKIVKTGVSEEGFGTLTKNKTIVQGPKPVTVFVDGVSNVTFLDDFRKQPWSCYSESENVMVYIRGKDDEQDDWWKSGQDYNGQAGVLVNAHYDSVSSGFGATDDGVGVVTILQLISYFSHEDHRPKRGLVALLNNGEENGLYGAHNYLQHPLSQFTHTFLNLEGAGAGGRAMLFRSTDAEVTNFYSNSPYPFGTIVSGDGFKRGFIRSGTDYSVFNGDHGMRGLDLAFFEPRTRYHTNQDDAKDTSADSVWHMLSASLSTVKAMTSYSGDEFEGGVSKTGRLKIGTGTNGVWFDLFGRAFAVMALPTLFLLSVVLLIVGPLLLIALEVVLRRGDKWYPLAKKQHLHSEDDDESVHFSGLRGLFRFPVAFAVATAAVLALAYLLAKVNPYIVYSSQYAVWTMMVTVWFLVAWLLLRGADRIRPTALQRMYSLIWLFALSWVLLVGATVGENSMGIASGYFLVVYNASIFVAVLISYLELFALPTKATFVDHVADADEEIERRSIRPGSQSSRSVLAAHDEDDANERTSLLRGGDRRSHNTFSRNNKRRHPDTDGTLEGTNDPYLTKAYGEEQAWSSSLPQWTWVLQFLVLAPINIVLIGQVGLMGSSATDQTPADGNPVLPIYLILAATSILILLPLTPFLHRVAYQIPTILFFAFVGCLIYNILAFPFSRDARLKVYFVQNVDLDIGINNVTLTGLNKYVQNIIDELPSAAGQKVSCGGQTTDTLRGGLASCTWHGLQPNVMNTEPITRQSKKHKSSHDYSSWLSYNITSHKNSAQISLRGRNTKACRLHFDTPISSLHISDAATDPRYKTVGENGSSQIRLFSRSWDKTFHVNVTWDGDAKGQTGKVACIWSDANLFGTIPAYDELVRFMPVWSAATKAADGLVEGWKGWEI